MVLKSVLVAFLASVLLFGANAQAQSWVNPETCTVPSIEISETRFPETWMVAQEDIYVNGRGKFWKITAPNGAVSHLWGTVHSSVIEVLKLPPELESAIETARVVMPEIAPDDWAAHLLTQDNDPEALIGAARDDPPHGFLTGEVRDWAIAWLEASGLGEEAMSFMTVQMLAEYLTEDPCLKYEALLPIQDIWILQKARIAGAVVTGLEAPQSFRLELAHPKWADHVRAIIQVFASYLNPAYFTGDGSYYGMYVQGRNAAMMSADLVDLKQVFGDEKGERLFELTQDYLVTFRNRRFVKTAQPELLKGGALLAVGAFHLPGENGMVALLRQEGFTVERIVVNGEIGTE